MASGLEDKELLARYGREGGMDICDFRFAISDCEAANAIAKGAGR